MAFFYPNPCNTGDFECAFYFTQLILLRLNLWLPISNCDLQMSASPKVKVKLKNKYLIIIIMHELKSDRFIGQVCRVNYYLLLYLIGS